jgi:hypothetical protein
MRFASLALLLVCASPSLTSAQVYLPPPPTTEELALDDARDVERDLTGARALRDTGAGMTLGGVLTTGLGVLFMFVPGGFENWSGLIVGGLAQGLGGLSLFIGLPMWIVGDVRQDILSAPFDRRLETAEQWELAGMITTLAGLALMAIGGGLMGLGATARDGEVRSPLLTAGAVGLNVGFLMATFIGPPMWGEGARF